MKKLLLVFAIIFTMLHAKAQPILNWQGTAGTSTPIRVNATAYDESGNLYVGGYFQSNIDLDFGPGEAILTPVGSYDAFVAKYNAFGEFQWARRIGGSSGDQVNGIYFANGELVVTGFFLGTTIFNSPLFNPQLVSNGSSDIFVVRYSTTGNIVTSPIKIGGTGNDEAAGVKVDAVGNIYLFGAIGSANVNFNLSGSTLLSSSGSNDGFVAKYDVNYTVQWVKGYGGGVGINDIVYDLDIDQQGNVYAVGEFGGAVSNFNNGVTLNTAGNADGFVAKINNLGNTLWARRIGSTGNDMIRNLKLDGKGAAYISGTFSSGPVNLNPNGTAINFSSLGSTDGFVSKLDTNLATATWIKHFGGNGADNIYALDIDTLGNVYTTGAFSTTALFPVGTSASSLTSSGVEDVFVSKINTLGNYVWSYRRGGALADLGRGISVSKNGNHVFVGGTEGNTLFLSKLGECNDVGIITGDKNLCATSQKVYSVAAVAGATSYIWTLPSGWSGTSTTNSITVTPSTNGGNITVTPITTCGNGFNRSISIVYGITAIDNNLVRHWLADSADNNRDRLNNFQLTLTNTVKDTDRFSTPNAAYRISNSTGFIGTGGSLPTGNTSIAFWYYYQKNGGINNVILGSNTGTVPAGHPLMLIDNNAERIYPWSNTGTAIGSGSVIAPNTWHHITLVRNGSSFVFYLNGAQVATGTNLATTNFDRIGNNRPGFETQGATGKFDEIRIYNIQIDAIQVQNIYNFGQVRRLNISQAACSGSTAQQSIQFSAMGANYQWFKNTQTAGTNSANYANTFVTGDTLIQVSTENQCITETYRKAYVVSNPTSSNITATACGTFMVGNKAYYRSGQYTTTLKGINGCDSVVNLNLTINNTTALKIDTNLIGHFTMNMGDTLANASIIKNRVGAITLSQTSLKLYTSDRHLNPGAAINMAEPFYFSNLIPYTNTTFSFWYRYEQPSVPLTQYLLGGNLFGTNGMYLGVNSANRLFSNDNFGNSSNGSTALDTNQWYHITIAFASNNSASVYLNGVLQYTIIGLATAPISTIGGFQGISNSGFGKIDDIRIFNKQLNATQTSQLVKRPSLLSWNPTNNLCVGETFNYNLAISDTNETIFEVYRNTTLVGTNPMGAFSNITKADTSITIKVLNNCTFEQYHTRLFINQEYDTIRAAVCGSYSFNGKTYTNSGLYRDTIIHSSTCTSFYTMFINVNDTNANRASSNGLIRYWSANASDIGRDLTGGDTLSLVGTVEYNVGRSGTASSGLRILGTTAVIRTNIPPMNVGTISFMYRHGAENTTKVLLGSNTNSLPNGNPLLVVVNNNFQVWNNTGTGTPISAFVNNNWYHIVLVRNGSNYKLYLNNNLVSEGNNLSVSNFDRLGNNRAGFETQGANGCIFDDIFIYNRELTPTEISILGSSTTLLSATKPTALCVGADATVRSSFQSAGGWKYSIWRGNNKIADTTFATISNVTLADTSTVVIKAFSNCRIVEYPIGLNISNQTADLNNGLLRFWTMKNTENRNSLTNGQSPYSITGSIIPELGRNNLDTSGAVQILDKNNHWINTDLATTELQNGQPYTVSFWLRSTFNNQGSEEGILISNSNASSVAPLQLSVGNQLQVLNNVGQPIYSSTNLPAGIWYHIVYANNGGGYYKLIVNGQIASEGSGSLPNWRPERIGNGRPALTNRGVRGRYDDIMIYNRVITDAEAVSIYNMPAIISTPLGLSSCNNNLTSFKWDMRDTTPTSYTFYRNANTTFADSTSLGFVVTAADTVVGMRIDKACSTIKLTSRINKSVTNLNNGLVRYWTMNAVDKEQSLSRAPFEPVQQFQRSSVTSMPYVLGGQALSMNNKVDYILLSFVATVNTTFSLWYRPNAVIGTESDRSILGSTTSSVLNAQVVGSELRLRPVGTNGNYLGSSYFTLTPGVFHHIVFTRNGTNYEVYVNDTLRLSGTGISQSIVQYVGNTNGFTFGALGFYDNIAVYNRAIGSDEAKALFRLPSLTAIPDTSALCAGASRNFAFTFGTSNQASYRVIKTAAPPSSTVTQLNANGSNATTTALAGEAISAVQSVGCAEMQYNFYPNVQGSSSAGPSLSYDPTTKRITATSSFNQSKLFRNGVLVLNNTSSGNINYLTTFRCGTYYAEYSNTGGNCPSISANLVITPTDTFNKIASLCPSSSITFGTQTITAAGVYFQTFAGVIGNCDSLVRLTVTPASPSSSSLSRNGCGSILLFGKTYTTSGQYLDTIPNAAGCDSVITLNLTIQPGGPSINNITRSDCYNFTLNGKTYTQTGVYRDTLFSASFTGCDSILVLNLTLNVSRVTLPSQVACKRYLFNNKLITTSGTYRDTLTNINSCDSIITITVTINTVDKTVTKTGNTLEATGTAINTYQWINCSNNLPITGATTSSFAPINSGDYAVILTGTNGCVDTSSCTNVTIGTCNISVSHTVLNPGNDPRCKNVLITVTNATVPVTYNISWLSNPTGNTATLNTLNNTYNDVCPDTYKVVVTDNNGCKDSVSFIINEPVGIAELVMNEIDIYPNPASNLVWLNQLPSKSTIKISDVTGKILYQKNTDNTILQIETTQWNNGLYFVEIEYADLRIIKKLIISK